jgi:pilus assembly protein CpaE
MTAAPQPSLPDPTPIVRVPVGPAAVERSDETVPSWAVVPAVDAASRPVVRVLLVTELERVAAHLAALLAPDKRVRVVETIADGSAAVERITSERPDVVIIDALLPGKLSGAGVTRALRARGLEVPVIFLTVPDRPLTLGPDLGAAEVMTLPVDGHVLLVSVLAAAARTEREAAPPAGTVAVFSAKGGVGRTAIAHNLAVAMSRRDGMRVALVDGDQVHGDLRLHLEAPEVAPSLLGLPTGHVTEDDLRPLLWQDASGLDVLLAPPRMEQADLIMLSDVRRALHLLRQTHDLVVIDVPAVMDDLTLAMLDEADVVLDVTTPRHGAVRKTQRCHEVLSAAGFPMDKVLTVVNHADADYDPADFAAVLGWSPDAVLMHDERLSSGSVAAGSSIVTSYPEALFSRGFADLATILASRLQPRLDRSVASAA